MAPKASQQKGKGAASDGDDAPSHLPKGSWEGSWVKEKRIELLHQGQVLPPADLMGCRPACHERVHAPEPGETVVFYDHFPRGFALPASDFLRQFMDHFHLQPHHIGENAMMTLAAFAALCEAYLGVWPNVELFRRLICFKTQTADSIPVVCGAASFYACKTADFPGLKGKESCKKMEVLLLLREESEEGGGLHQPVALRRKWARRTGQLERSTPSSRVGRGEDPPTNHHSAKGGWPEAIRPLACLPGRPRVAPPALLTQDVLPGICQGSHSSFFQSTDGGRGGAEGE
jgi:hypothetical protein